MVHILRLVIELLRQPRRRIFGVRLRRLVGVLGRGHKDARLLGFEQRVAAGLDADRGRSRVDRGVQLGHARLEVVLAARRVVAVDRETVAERHAAVHAHDQMVGGGVFQKVVAVVGERALAFLLGRHVEADRQADGQHQQHDPQADGPLAGRRQQALPAHETEDVDQDRAEQRECAQHQADVEDDVADLPQDGQPGGGQHELVPAVDHDGDAGDRGERYQQRHAPPAPDAHHGDGQHDAPGQNQARSPHVKSVQPGGQQHQRAEQNRDDTRAALRDGTETAGGRGGRQRRLAAGN